MAYIFWKYTIMDIKAEGFQRAFEIYFCVLIFYWYFANNLKF